MSGCPRFLKIQLMFTMPFANFQSSVQGIADQMNYPVKGLRDAFMKRTQSLREIRNMEFELIYTKNS